MESDAEEEQRYVIGMRKTIEATDARLKGEVALYNGGNGLRPLFTFHSPRVPLVKNE